MHRTYLRRPDLRVCQGQSACRSSAKGQLTGTLSGRDLGQLLSRDGLEKAMKVAGKGL